GGGQERRMTWLVVLVGGALGSAARHWVNLEVAHRWNRAVPYAPAIVNLVGAGAIGFLAGGIASGRFAMSPHVRTLVFVGLLGGFTTFSSFMLDTFTLAHGGETTIAITNLVAQNAIGLCLVWAGYQAGL